MHGPINRPNVPGTERWHFAQYIGMYSTGHDMGIPVALILACGTQGKGLVIQGLGLVMDKTKLLYISGNAHSALWSYSPSRARGGSRKFIAIYRVLGPSLTRNFVHYNVISCGVQISSLSVFAQPQEPGLPTPESITRPLGDFTPEKLSGRKPRPACTPLLDIHLSFL